jgi:SOS response regulatory protein OraA/RecX
MRPSITITALLSAGAIAIGGVAAGCAPVDNEPQAKRAPTEQSEATASKVSAAEGPMESVSEANARASAEQYLSTMAFSRTGLIKQLRYEGFTTADATYAAGAVDVNWNEQAAKSAEQYLSGQAFSRSGLIKQLRYEGYTPGQAEYGVRHTGLGSADASDAPAAGGSTESVSEANARASADQYLSGQAFSRSGLIRQLEYEGFSTADATHGVDAVSADWREQAAKSAEQYLSGQSFSRSGLITQLEYEGFTAEQALYGVNQTGL